MTDNDRMDELGDLLGEGWYSLLSSDPNYLLPPLKELVLLWRRPHTPADYGEYTVGHRHKDEHPWGWQIRGLYTGQQLGSAYPYTHWRWLPSPPRPIA